MKTLKLSFLAAFLILGIAVVALTAADDPLSGTWVGDWGPTPTHRNQATVELKWDGKTLTGEVNPGPNAVELKSTTFDPKSGAIHMEADATGRRGAVHYTIDGKVEGDTITGSWNHDDRKGGFKITKK
jgi:hypothetical protein